MINIVIVDDDIPRVDAFLESLSEKEYFSYLKIDTCYSADEARVKLMKEADILILDVLLPKKRKGIPSSSISGELLSDVFKPKSVLFRPKLIIGLTADIDYLNDHQTLFQRYATIVFEAKKNSNSWMDKIFLQINSYVESERKRVAINRNKLLITVHGIRTYGSWQKIISSKIDDYSNEYVHHHFNYGYFDLLSFCIPFLRDKKKRQISNKINRCLSRYPNHEVDIIAHSFGTCIAKDSIEKHEGIFKNIIFCGSPLPANSDVNIIVSKSNQFVNECGIYDFILLLSKVSLPGLGDAGRIGFNHESGKSFSNRFHIGSHSLYFNDEDDYKFIKSLWVPILTSDTKPVDVDKRKNYFLEDVVEFTLSFFESYKSLLIMASFIYFLYKVFAN